MLWTNGHISGKEDATLIVVVLAFYIFLSCNACKGSTTYTDKTVNSRYIMNNHMPACYYVTSTDNFYEYGFKCNNTNKNVDKKP